MLACVVWLVSEVAKLFGSSRTYIAFFFFQAEDGIRDYKVTGVQTCALPIYLQGAVSAGLLAVGSSFVGTMENCAALLDRIAAAADPEAEARAIARHHKALKSPVPGFGHHLHKQIGRASCRERV